MATSQRLGTTELLYRCAREMGLSPSWVKPNHTFAISTDDGERYVSFTRSPLNSHLGRDLAKDKHLTRLIMQRHNLPNIPFLQANTQAEAAQFLDTYKKIIAKPTHGSGAHDIHVITDTAMLAPLTIPDYILEQYIAGEEIRYLVLNESVIGVYRSDYGTSVDEHRPLRCISYPQTMWSPVLSNLSLETTRILGLRFAAVDFMIDRSGRGYILEVNTMPDFKWFHAPSAGPAVNVAQLFLEAMFADERTRAPELLAMSNGSELL